MIERIERYTFDGKEFKDLNAVYRYVENEIGKIIDNTPNRLSPKDALAVWQAIVDNRERLCNLLSANYLADPDELRSDKVNILDWNNK